MSVMLVHTAVAWMMTKIVIRLVWKRETKNDPTTISICKWKFFLSKYYVILNCITHLSCLSLELSGHIMNATISSSFLFYLLRRRIQICKLGIFFSRSLLLVLLNSIFIICLHIESANSDTQMYTDTYTIADRMYPLWKWKKKNEKSCVAKINAFIPFNILFVFRPVSSSFILCNCNFSCL